MIMSNLSSLLPSTPHNPWLLQTLWIPIRYPWKPINTTVWNSHWRNWLKSLLSKFQKKLHYIFSSSSLDQALIIKIYTETKNWIISLLITMWNFLIFNTDLNYLERSKSKPELLEKDEKGLLILMVSYKLFNRFGSESSSFVTFFAVNYFWKNFIFYFLMF